MGKSTQKTPPAWVDRDPLPSPTYGEVRRRRIGYIPTWKRSSFFFCLKIWDFNSIKSDKLGCTFYSTTLVTSPLPVHFLSTSMYSDWLRSRSSYLQWSHLAHSLTNSSRLSSGQCRIPNTLILENHEIYFIKFFLYQTPTPEIITFNVDSDASLTTSNASRDSLNLYLCVIRVLGFTLPEATSSTAAG